MAVELEVGAALRTDVRALASAALTKPDRLVGQSNGGEGVVRVYYYVLLRSKYLNKFVYY